MLISRDQYEDPRRDEEELSDEARAYAEEREEQRIAEYVKGGEK